MKHILLLIEHQRNRELLAQTLEAYYDVLIPDLDVDFTTAGTEILQSDFDLCFMDYTAIHLLRDKMLARRQAAVPCYLPFVFLTNLHDVGFSSDHLEPLIDDLIHLPIEKAELRTRMRVLLRSRSYSLQLEAAQAELNQFLTQEKELNKIKSRFVSTVSHEFRNPLNSISGMAQILETFGDKLTPEKRADVLKQLRRNVTKMTDLLNNVLVVSQKDMDRLQFNPALMDLPAFCRGLINEVQTAFDRQQTINFTYQPTTAEFNLDSKLLDYILSNLLTNACKYSPHNSEIDFTVELQSAQLIFTVGDRGIGIPPEDIPHLFELFYRASNSLDYQGTGLGLAIAKEYVEYHGGNISVISQPGESTTFTVVIPVEDEVESRE